MVCRLLNLRGLQLLKTAISKGRVWLWPIVAMVITTEATGCATARPPFPEFAEEVRHLRIGMTQEEVRATLGQPRLQGWELHPKFQQQLWTFDYMKIRTFVGDLHLIIFFKDNRVIDWKEWHIPLNL